MIDADFTSLSKAARQRREADGVSKGGFSGDEACEGLVAVADDRPAGVTRPDHVDECHRRDASPLGRVSASVTLLG